MEFAHTGAFLSGVLSYLTIDDFINLYTKKHRGCGCNLGVKDMYVIVILRL